MRLINCVQLILETLCSACASGALRGRQPPFRRMGRSALAGLAGGVATVTLGLAGGFVFDNAGDARCFGLFSGVYFGTCFCDKGFFAFAGFPFDTDLLLGLQSVAFGMALFALVLAGILIVIFGLSTRSRLQSLALGCALRARMGRE